MEKVAVTPYGYSINALGAYTARNNLRFGGVGIAPRTRHHAYAFSVLRGHRTMHKPHFGQFRKSVTVDRTIFFCIFGSWQHL